MKPGSLVWVPWKRCLWPALVQTANDTTLGVNIFGDLASFAMSSEYALPFAEHYPRLAHQLNTPEFMQSVELAAQAHAAQALAPTSQQMQTSTSTSSSSSSDHSHNGNDNHDDNARSDSGDSTPVSLVRAMSNTTTATANSIEHAAVFGRPPPPLSLMSPSSSGSSGGQYQADSHTRSHHRAGADDSASVLSHSTSTATAMATATSSPPRPRAAASTLVPTEHVSPSTSPRPQLEMLPCPGELTPTLVPTSVSEIQNGTRILIRAAHRIHPSLRAYALTPAVVVEAPVHPNTWYQVQLVDGKRVKIRKSAFDVAGTVTASPSSSVHTGPSPRGSSSTTGGAQEVPALQLNMPSPSSSSGHFSALSPAASSISTPSNLIGRRVLLLASQELMARAPWLVSQPAVIVGLSTNRNMYIARTATGQCVPVHRDAFQVIDAPRSAPSYGPGPSASTPHSYTQQLQHQSGPSPANSPRLTPHTIKLPSQRPQSHKASPRLTPQQQQQPMSPKMAALTQAAGGAPSPQSSPYLTSQPAPGMPPRRPKPKVKAKKLIGSKVRIEAGRFKGEIGYVLRGGNGYFCVQLKTDHSSDGLKDGNSIMKRSADLRMLDSSEDSSDDEFPVIAGGDGDDDDDGSGEQEEEVYAVGPPPPRRQYSGQSQHQSSTGTRHLQLPSAGSGSGSISAPSSPSLTPRTRKLSDGDLDGPSRKRPRVAPMNETLIDRKVYVKIGKGEGEVGTVLRSGHGFYCVLIPGQGEVMKRANELEICELDMPLEGVAEHEEGTICKAACILLNLLHARSQPSPALKPSEALIKPPAITVSTAAPSVPTHGLPPLQFPSPVAFNPEFNERASEDLSKATMLAPSAVSLWSNDAVVPLSVSSSSLSETASSISASVSATARTSSVPKSVSAIDMLRLAANGPASASASAPLASTSASSQFVAMGASSLIRPPHMSVAVIASESPEKAEQGARWGINPPLLSPFQPKPNLPVV